MPKKAREKKPEYDKLSHAVQVLLKPHEFKIMDKIRRETNYPNNSAYVRSLILDHVKRKRQTELL